MLFDIKEDDEPPVMSQETGGDLQPPALQDRLYGQEAAEQQILTMFNQNRMPHALMLVGPKGVGKATFVYRLVRFLMKQERAENAGGLFGAEEPAAAHHSLDVAADEAVFGKIAAGGHPDFLLVEPPTDPKTGRVKNDIPVEAIRRINPFIRKTAAEAAWRIVMVDEADSMNRNAQNALLKILEEPPKNSLILLVCHRTGTLLPTIRSRCAVLKFGTLSEEIVARFTAKTGAADNLNDLIALMAQGSLGRLSFFEDEAAVQILETLHGLMARWPDMKWTDIHRMAEQAGRAANKQHEHVIKLYFDTLLTILAKAKAMGQPPPHAFSGEGFQNLMREKTAGDFCDWHKDILYRLDQAQFANLDLRNVILNVFRVVLS